MEIRCFKLSEMKALRRQRVQDTNRAVVGGEDFRQTTIGLRRFVEVNPKAEICITLAEHNTTYNE